MTSNSLPHPVLVATLLSGHLQHISITSNARLFSPLLLRLDFDFDYRNSKSFYYTCIFFGASELLLEQFCFSILLSCFLDQQVRRKNLFFASDLKSYQQSLLLACQSNLLACWEGFIYLKFFQSKPNSGNCIHFEFFKVDDVAKFIEEISIQLQQSQLGIL